MNPADRNAKRATHGSVKEAVCLAHNAGLTARQVAERIRVNANSVHTAARRCGVRLASGSKEGQR